MREHTEQVRVNSCTFWNRKQLTKRIKFRQRSRQQFHYSVPGNSVLVITRISHFQLRHTQAKYKRKNAAESQPLDTIYLKLKNDALQKRVGILIILST